MEGPSRLHNLIVVGLVVAVVTSVCILVSDVSAQGDAQGSVAADRAALEALYRATSGPNWTVSTNWLSAEPLSSWYGVETNGNGRVTNLELRSNNLSGSLPSELGNLASLETLQIYVNPLLGGPIPPELGRLTSLEGLVFSSNQLSGPIPPELGRLTGLKYLHLGYGNQLSGSIPPELGRLANLELLNLVGNRLSGPIPPELGQLASLESLDLGGNQLSGSIPPELGRLARLRQVLGLWGNQLSGPIPPELGQLANLDWLRLESNQLSGSIPPELGQLASLEALGLWGNQLSGPIPPELGQLTSLDWLRLDSNQLSGPIPPELGRLANLHWLWLNNNQLSGSIPAELGRLANLEEISLQNNLLTGSLPRNLMRVLTLTYLNISGTSVCVPGDAAFQAWTATLRYFLHPGLTCSGLMVSFDPAWYTVAEGEIVPVTVHLSAAEAPAGAVTVPLTGTPGSGATAGDYAGVPASVTFSPTDTMATFAFEARADADSDDGETVILGIGRPLPPGVTAGNPATATVTLTDEDDDGVARDRAALEALYQGTDGPRWVSRANWLSDEPLSSWAGVRTDGNGRVTRLELNHNQLRGELPAAPLVDLTALRSLNLSYNEMLTGPLTRSLMELSALRTLNIERTALCVPADAAFRTWVATIDFHSSELACGVSVAVSFGGASYTVAEGGSVPVTVRLSEVPARSVTVALTATPGNGATTVDYEVPASVTFGPSDTTATFSLEARADADSDDGETVTLGRVRLFFVGRPNQSFAAAARQEAVGSVSAWSW